MKKIMLTFLVFVSVITAMAETPVQALVEEYRDVRGVKDFVVSGRMMNMARPLLRYYSIGPLAPNVTEMCILNMNKANPSVKALFEESLQRTLSLYQYAGKTMTPNGLVDAYVHLFSSATVDELVIYNPEIQALYSLVGQFSVSELKEIEKKD